MIAQGDVIGGVTVAIAADLTALRAGKVEAQRATAEISRLVAPVKIVADASSLRAQATMAAAAATTGLAMRIPVMLDLGPLRAQMMALQSMMRGGGAAGGVRGVFAPNFVEGQVVSSRTVSSPMLMLPGPGGGRAPTSRTTTIPGAGSDVLAFGGKAFTAAAIASMGAQGYRAAMTPDDSSVSADLEADRAAYLKSFTGGGLLNTVGKFTRGIPIIGELGDAEYRLRSSVKNFATGRGWGSDQGYAEDVMSEEGPRRKRIEAAIEQADRARDARRKRDSTAKEKFDEERRLTMDAQTELTRLTIRGQSERARASMSGARAEIEILQNSFREQQAIAKAEIDKMMITGASATRVALANASRVALTQAEQAAVAGMRQAQDRAASGLRMDAAQSARSSGLRLTGNGNQADLEDLISSYAGRIDRAIQEFGSGSPEVNAIKAERDAKVRELQREQQVNASEASISAEDASAISSMRVAGRNRAAARRAVISANDASVRAAERRYGPNSPEYQAAKQRGAADLAELDAQQAREAADFGNSINTRIGAASAAGMGQGRLAGIIGRIGSARSELAAAEPAERDAIIRAQRAEIGGELASLMRGGGYAREFDPLREAPGGPDGGKEMIEIMRRVADYLDEIRKQPGGLR